MTLSMPIKKVVPPSRIKGMANGKIDASCLEAVEPNKTSLVYLMVHEPARAMRALHVAAQVAGITLSTTGRGRTYDQQYSLFFQRYSPTPIAGQSTKVFQGKTFWLKKGMAMAAVPGTSNHGYWLADDLAEIVNGAVVSLRASTVQWLFANAPKYGFNWETTTENWHVTWTAGDKMPQVVLDYEGIVTPPTPPATPPANLPAFDPANGKYSLYPYNRNKTAISKDATGPEVQYLQAVLHNKANQTYVNITGSYDDLTVWGVTALQKFVGQPVSGVCDPALWVIIDGLALS